MRWNLSTNELKVRIRTKMLTTKPFRETVDLLTQNKGLAANQAGSLDGQD